LAFREDALDEGGKIIRVRHNRKIADVREVSKREAQRIARKILGELDGQMLRPASLMTVAEFYEQSFKPEVMWALKHAGQKHYKYILGQRVLPCIGELRLRDNIHNPLQALVKMTIETGHSVQLAVHIRNAVSALFNHAKRKGVFFGDNPAQGIRLPEMQRRETHSLNFEQARLVLMAFPPPVQEMALLSITASLNAAEMLGLRIKRLNLTDQPVVVSGEVLQPRTLAVRENYYRGKFGSVKAKSRRRDVPLSSSVVAALSAYLARSRFVGPDDLVFASRKGTPLNDSNLLRRVIKPVGKKLGLPWLSWHVFRHTHATLGEQIGMALSDRQAQMGHGDVRMTLHYTHSDLDRRRDSVEAMTERLLGKALGSVN
jgi:integrase